MNNHCLLRPPLCSACRRLPDCEGRGSVLCLPPTAAAPSGFCPYFRFGRAVPGLVIPRGIRIFRDESPPAA